MKAEEALALIALAARADPADMYGADGRILPVTEWPREFRLCVKAVSHDADGSVIKVVLVDPLKARELLAIAAGKLRTNVNVNVFDHEGHLAEVARRVAEQEKQGGR
jgi:hypothetical protein